MFWSGEWRRQPLSVCSSGGGGGANMGGCVRSRRRWLAVFVSVSFSVDYRIEVTAGFFLLSTSSLKVIASRTRLGLAV